MRLFGYAGLLVVVAGTAVADPITIEAEGNGLSRDVAVSKALISAVEQATGVTIDEQQAMSMGAAQTISANQTHVEVEQSTQSSIVRKAGGRITSYDIESLTTAPDGGFVAHLRASVEVFRPKGISNDKRRRVAVAQFEAGADHAPDELELHEKLVQYLTQSRRFAVVDRSNDRIYKQEMELITSNDAAPAERTRAGQVIGADYVITGHLKVSPAKTLGEPSRTSSHVLELTGEVVTTTVPSTLRQIPRMISLSFEVIEISTRQVKFADQIDDVVGDIGTLAGLVSARITGAIYPPRLIDTDDPAALVINQGGGGVSAGQHLRVMREGKELFDPYTNEPLGSRETQVAVVEIVEVGEKVSYARLVSGKLDGEANSFILRPEWGSIGKH
jgi:curli biogenesis system outer membrane secretion channel CsgG